jgi:hypothetical protein
MMQTQCLGVDGNQLHHSIPCLNIIINYMAAIRENQQ